ncbi:Uncharacterized protein dnm_060690 [Desulfonema magnum]|uniref:Uncharacterized protein n=1 Tax=Desulfonema magnum TaxID=45655 RepID=A0A975BRR6_9BACT|nr:Uncharacterized protein dnm_060690 [Desulfonema magnum]
MNRFLSFAVEANQNISTIGRRSTGKTDKKRKTVCSPK